MLAPYLTRPSIGYGIEKIDEFSGFYHQRARSETREKSGTGETV